MAARAGMEWLIAQLRRMAAADETGWTDDDLQAALDRTRAEVRGLPVEPLAQRAGQTAYSDYLIPPSVRDVEYAPPHGDDGWRLVDSSGQAAPQHTVSLAAGVITFDAPTDGRTYYLDCRSYDLNGAAAEIWDQKAAAAAASVDWQSDNHRISASQEIEHCLRMAQMYRARARASVRAAMMTRSDEAW